MDNKSIFVRTSTGEEQVQSRTSPLSGDVKRALSMVDGVSTFGEISKRAAPSMRANLADMFEELEKSGLIQEKGMSGKIAKSAAPSKMAMPVKIATPRKPAPEKVSDELDFMSSYQTPARADRAGDNNTNLGDAEQQARQRLEAAAREQREAEAARTKAEQEARRVREELEAAKLKAEQEARLRLEAAERERKEAEAARIKAEQEARRVREELEAAKLKAEQEARLRAEAEARERKEAEAARIKAEQEAVRIRAEQEAARIRAEQEAAQRQADEERARRKAELEGEAALRQAEQEAEQARKAAEALQKSAGTDLGVTGSFAFDAFKIDEIQPAAPRTKPEPAQKPGFGETASAAAKQDAFSFDSFNLEEQRPAEPPKERQAAKPAQPDAAPARPATPPVTDEAAARERAEKEKAGRDKAEKEKAEKERAKREAQARAEEEARIKEYADAEAKVWAEAEQRALETARVNAERAAHRTEHSRDTARAEKAKRPARAPRKPFAWGKLFGSIVMLGIILLVLLVGALFVAPNFLPTRDYMPKVQKLLSDELHQPVHLGYLSGRFLPTPRLDLGEIYIGDAKQFQAATAQINFDIFGVFGDNKPIDSVDFQKVTVRGISLRDSGAWLQKLASSSQFPVSRMTISEGTLDADVFQLTGVEGELDYSPAGKFTHAAFRANAGKYSVAIDQLAGGKFKTNLTVHAGALPLLPDWNFDELNASGEISGDELLISKFDAQIFDGTLQGNAHLNWHSGWHADGSFTARKIVMKNFSKLLDGNVDGSAHFRMSSQDLGGLTDSALLDGKFVSSDGLIGGLDIVETARTRSRTNLPGGRTRYDNLQGDFNYSKDAYHFTQVKIAGGVMDALASFDIGNQQLTGKMKVNLDMHGLASTELKLGGAIDDPTLVYAP
jgi:hypothetical protein